MNPGALEEGAKTANSFIEAMKSQPLALALVFVVVAQLGFIYYQGVAVNNMRRENVAIFVQTMGDMQKLLAKCVVPGT